MIRDKTYIFAADNKFISNLIKTQVSDLDFEVEFIA